MYATLNYITSSLVNRFDCVFVHLTMLFVVEFDNIVKVLRCNICRRNNGTILCDANNPAG